MHRNGVVGPLRRVSGKRAARKLLFLLLLAHTGWGLSMYEAHCVVLGGTGRGSRRCSFLLNPPCEPLARPPIAGQAAHVGWGVSEKV